MENITKKKMNESSIEFYLNAELIEEFICPICLNILEEPVIDSC